MMNKQPYRTPPRWWSPRLSNSWVELLRPLRQRWGRSGEGLVNVSVRHGEYVREALDDRAGVMIVPNHPSHADPYAMLAAADALDTRFYFMTAWQVFQKTHWLGRFVLRRHGCFSINREGHDIRAMRQAVNILRSAAEPLVIFPEGEVYHVNDRVMPFRRGAVALAQRAASQTTRPVVAIPAAIRYEYLSDPRPGLAEVLRRLEAFVGVSTDASRDLVSRVQTVGIAELNRREIQYFGATRRGPVTVRRMQLMQHVLASVEQSVGSSGVHVSVPQRVKEARRRLIQRIESQGSAEDREFVEAGFNDLFFVMQLFSYPSTYLSDNPPIERVAETIDKLEEDLLGTSTTHERGRRHATVTFGAPVSIPKTSGTRQQSLQLTALLEERVAELLRDGASYSEDTVLPPRIAASTRERGSSLRLSPVP
jgi:1-acyl-sn-glycerol-3-phosphate acyltransferase